MLPLRRCRCSACIGDIPQAVAAVGPARSRSRARAAGASPGVSETSACRTSSESSASRTEPPDATPTLPPMRADRGKQLLKNGVYRVLGEATSEVGIPNGDDERTLRVLMYHKVNDLSPNPTTVPTAVFADQMALLSELGYVPVSLEAVRDHYLEGAPLPGGAVLITFDDGYRDNLENALPVLQARGYPAVVFVPIGYLDDGRPLPHEELLLALGVRNKTLDWDELAVLEAGGVRVESHGIGHWPLTALEPGAAAREIALGVRVRQGLASRLPARARKPCPAGGLQARVHVHLGVERSRERPLSAPSLQHRAVSGPHVRARAAGGVRSDRGERHCPRNVRAAGAQRRAGNGDALMFDARLRLTFTGETMFPPCDPLLLDYVGNLPVPHTPPREARETVRAAS
ncbi:MAG: polysaccharide deacetylase family protein [Actinobacteria bacterium]|nr:MAG: polysaccharide deacetylase family protein [Actinomycetota bacterium]